MNSQYANYLGRRFIAVARACRRSKCLSDHTGASLTFGQTLTAALVLKRMFRRFVHQYRMIGILLPPSVPAALTNIAVDLAGGVAVNLNYTLSASQMAHCIDTCGLKHIITSRTFLARAGIEPQPSMIFLEDVKRRVSIFAKLLAAATGRLAPASWLYVSRATPPASELATVVFSSGSSGEPKGVMLSHGNILSDIDGFTRMVDLRTSDNLCGVLPFFHSFGYTCTLWLPLVHGFSVAYVPNPLDAAAISAVAGRNQSTILLSTPSFLLRYCRRVKKEDFAHLRVVLTGAEKLRQQVADHFNDAFGMRPIEGYGCTELSPVVSVNVPASLASDLEFTGAKSGTVGRPLPNLQCRIVSPWDHRDVAPSQSGVLLVRGPTVMMGYLNREQDTAAVLQDGWYNTGDIASIDAEGFLTITDRLSRFSKIAGEMVSHGALERMYHDALDACERVVVVTGIDHDHRGEELAVLFDHHAATPEQLHTIATDSDLPNLWKPRRTHYIPVESLPLLGSGKPDLVACRVTARTALNADEG